MENSTAGLLGSSREERYLVTIALTAVILVSVFAFLYLDVRAKYDVLIERQERIQAQIENAQAQLEGLQTLLRELLRLNASRRLTPTQIYNMSKSSVVLIANRQYRVDGLKTVSEGSGFIYDRAGYIVTNNHVVEGAREIRVTFPDGTIMTATLVGADVYSDLAVIKVDVPPESASVLLRPLTLGNSSLLVVGEPVYAIGNPFGLSGSMTQGIVSQLGRSIQTKGGYSIVDVIQIDAAINPGNSGGPLLNSLGEVVGVTTAIATATGTFSGVGFAIPSNLMKRVIPALIETGHYHHPWVGIQGINMMPEMAEAMGTNYTRGFLITAVVPDSPAERAGLRGGSRTIIVEGREIPIGGDIIVGVDGRFVADVDDMLTYLERYKSPGDVVRLLIVRDNVPQEVFLTLGKRP